MARRPRRTNRPRTHSSGTSRSANGTTPPSRSKTIQKITSGIYRFTPIKPYSRTYVRRKIRTASKWTAPLNPVLVPTRKVIHTAKTLSSRTRAKGRARPVRADMNQTTNRPGRSAAEAKSDRKDVASALQRSRFTPVIDPTDQGVRTCKQRPSNNKGNGSSRPFIPWCDRRR